MNGSLFKIDKIRWDLPQQHCPLAVGVHAAISRAML
jgi:hypothetical protein